MKPIVPCADLTCRHAIQDKVGVLNKLSANLFQRESQEGMENPLFVCAVELFDKYLNHLRHSNENLSAFWIPYL